MRTLILLSIALTLAAGVANGSPVTVRFEGAVTRLFGNAPIDIGTPFAGTYTFDSDTSPTMNADPTRPGFLYYNHYQSEFGGILSLGGESYFTDQPFSDGRRLIISMYDDDRFEDDQVLISTVLGTSSAPLAGGFYILLSDSTRRALSSPELLPGAPNLSDWESALFGFNSANWDVHGSISKIEVIPEPTTTLLLLLGFAVLSGIGPSRAA